MILLDPTTIILMATLMAGAMSVVLYSAHLSFPKEIKGLKQWAGGLLLLAVGSVCFSLRGGILGNTLPLICANSVLMWALGLTLIGTQKLYGQRPSWWLFHLIWALAMLGVGYWLIVEPNFAARVAVFSFLCFIFYACQVVLIYRFGEPHFSSKFFGALMFLQSVVVLTRGILALYMGSEHATLLTVGPFQSIYLATAHFMILLLAVGFMAVATRRLQTILERRSTLDPLTQVLNRRGFADIYAKEHALMLRESTAMTMLSIDLDYFKKINDRYGHATGDRVLIDVAEVIGKALRVSDHVARFGGEEFIVLLPNTGLDRARHIAERIQTALREPHGQGLPAYTVSIGIACQASADENLDGILMRADKALYSAKELGRDRIEIAAEGPPPKQAVRA
ncbi:GGDEF domain-containing protein [Duganella sp. LjRoot269]|uniref:GGDEF domain-containing protein n=1 Tax=Duganella sp. LjRoot269 TaxID=3342305 RepID=UPI003ECC1A28